MAASVKFILACLLMFTWLFLAQSQLDGNSAPDQNILDFTRKGLREVASYATTATDNKIGGRKMAVHKVKEHGGNGHAEGKWGSNMEEHKHRVDHYFSEEADDDDDAGFVAFTADYHPPRHHPPKNN